MTVQMLLGAAPGDSFDAAVARIAHAPPWSPFDPRAIEFVGRVSLRLLRRPEVREYPEVAAMAHWFRAARLVEWAESQDRQRLRFGRGLAFHIAPANVDSVFMYSWLISALAGNTNVVRVSQRQSAQIDLLLRALAEVLEEDVGAPFRGRLLLLTYPHDAAVTEQLSRVCMVRVVWGGDATVAAVRAIPLRPTAVELAFPDRFSMAALNAEAVLGCDNAALGALAAQFFNDAFWFAQQACSSPRLVGWVGEARSISAAQPRFWDAVGTEARRRGAENTPAMVATRVSTLFEYAARGYGRAAGRLADFPLRIAMSVGLDAAARDLHCGNGLFLECACDSLDTMLSQMTDRDQTLAVFGFTAGELRAAAARLPARSVDRIVPIGQALAFDGVWDGIDLLSAFTREVVISPSIPF